MHTFLKIALDGNGLSALGPCRFTSRQKLWCRWIEIWEFPKTGLNAFHKRKISYLCRDTKYKFSLAQKKSLQYINPLNPELNPICYLLALLAYHFLHVSRIMVKSLTLRLLMSYTYGAHILDVSRLHTTTQHSR